MRSPLTAAAVCLALHVGAPVAQAAEQHPPVAAQTCTPQAADAALKTAKGAAPATPAAPVRGELIKTAAAGTRDEPPAMRSGAHGAADDEDHPKRGGTAMLLAALALMSGIALRRYGAPRP